MSDNKGTFNYTYSAAQEREVEAIRQKYAEDTTPIEVDKMEQLRRLDAGVTNKASVVAMCMGIISALIMGFGMSLIMTDLADKIGLSSPIVFGVIIGVVGMVGIIAAYPIYQVILKRERKRKAPQILKLTEELSQK